MNELLGYLIRCGYYGRDISLIPKDKLSKIKNLPGAEIILKTEIEKDKINYDINIKVSNWPIFKKNSIKSIIGIGSDCLKNNKIEDILNTLKTPRNYVIRMEKRLLNKIAYGNIFANLTQHKVIGILIQDSPLNIADISKATELGLSEVKRTLKTIYKFNIANEIGKDKIEINWMKIDQNVEDYLAKNKLFTKSLNLITEEKVNCKEVENISNEVKKECIPIEKEEEKSINEYSAIEYLIKCGYSGKKVSSISKEIFQAIKNIEGVEIILSKELENLCYENFSEIKKWPDLNLNSTNKIIGLSSKSLKRYDKNSIFNALKSTSKYVIRMDLPTLNKIGFNYTLNSWEEIRIAGFLLGVASSKKETISKLTKINIDIVEMCISNLNLKGFINSSQNGKVSIEWSIISKNIKFYIEKIKDKKEIDQENKGILESNLKNNFEKIKLNNEIQEIEKNNVKKELTSNLVENNILKSNEFQKLLTEKELKVFKKYKTKDFFENSEKNLHAVELKLVMEKEKKKLLEKSKKFSNEKKKSLKNQIKNEVKNKIKIINSIIKKIMDFLKKKCKGLDILTKEEKLNQEKLIKESKEVTKEMIKRQEENFKKMNVKELEKFKGGAYKLVKQFTKLIKNGYAGKSLSEIEVKKLDNFRLLPGIEIILTSKIEPTNNNFSLPLSLKKWPPLNLDSTEEIIGLDSNSLSNYSAQKILKALKIPNLYSIRINLNYINKIIFNNLLQNFYQLYISLYLIGKKPLTAEEISKSTKISLLEIEESLKETVIKKYIEFKDNKYSVNSSKFDKALKFVSFNYIVDEKFNKIDKKLENKSINFDNKNFIYKLVDSSSSEENINTDLFNNQNSVTKIDYNISKDFDNLKISKQKEIIDNISKQDNCNIVEEIDSKNTNNNILNVCNSFDSTLNRNSNNFTNISNLNNLKNISKNDIFQNILEDSNNFEKNLNNFLLSQNNKNILEKIPDMSAIDSYNSAISALKKQKSKAIIEEKKDELNNNLDEINKSNLTNKSVNNSDLINKSQNKSDFINKSNSTGKFENNSDLANSSNLIKSTSPKKTKVVISPRKQADKNFNDKSFSEELNNFNSSLSVDRKLSEDSDIPTLSSPKKSQDNNNFVKNVEAPFTINPKIKLNPKQDIIYREPTQYPLETENIYSSAKRMNVNISNKYKEKQILKLYNDSINIVLDHPNGIPIKSLKIHTRASDLEMKEIISYFYKDPNFVVLEKDGIPYKIVKYQKSITMPDWKRSLIEYATVKDMFIFSSKSEDIKKILQGGTEINEEVVLDILESAGFEIREFRSKFVPCEYIIRNPNNNKKYELDLMILEVKKNITKKFMERIKNVFFNNPIQNSLDNGFVLELGERVKILYNFLIEQIKNNDYQHLLNQNSILDMKYSTFKSIVPIRTDLIAVRLIISLGAADFISDCGKNFSITDIFEKDVSEYFMRNDSCNQLLENFTMRDIIRKLIGKVSTRYIDIETISPIAKYLTRRTQVCEYGKLLHILYKSNCFEKTEDDQFLYFELIEGIEEYLQTIFDGIESSYKISSNITHIPYHIRKDFYEMVSEFSQDEFYEKSKKILSIYFDKKTQKVFMEMLEQFNK